MLFFIAGVPGVFDSLWLKSRPDLARSPKAQRGHKESQGTKDSNRSKIVAHPRMIFYSSMSLDRSRANPSIGPSPVKTWSNP